MSTNKPLLTVGLPVYNGERYLGNAIECILSQSFKDFEFIISDNASTDGTEEICRHYEGRDRRIRYHRNAVNMGGAKNSDLILDMARTEFFTTASHDDYFSLNYLEACLAKLQQTEDAVLCCPEQVVFLDPRGNPTRAERNCNTERKDLVGRMHELVKKLGWYAWYGVTRTEVLRSLLNGMRRYRYAYGGDVIFMATALTRGQIVVSPGTTFFYREPDRAKAFATHMEEILPGSAAPTRPYTGLAGDLLQVVLDSDVPEQAKAEACQAMLKTIANQPEWVNVLARENADAVIGELAAKLPQMAPVCPPVSEQYLAGAHEKSGSVAKLRLVAVAPFPVCPPSSTSEQRIAQLYQGLVGRCEVDLITLTGPDVAVGQFNLSPTVREIRIAKSLMHLRREAELNKAAGMPVEDLSMMIWARETPDYLETLREHVVDADIVCISQPYLFPIIAQVWGGPVVYDAHRIEVDYKRQMLPDSPVKASLLQSVERVERSCVTGSTLILCGSEKEQRRLNELYGVPLDRLYIVPNGYSSGTVPFVGIKDRRTRIGGAKRPPIAFFSAAHVPASVQAVKHILSFAKECPDIQFIVTGGVCEAYQDSESLNNVRFVRQLTDDDKKRLLGLAAVALFPFEGEADATAMVIDCFVAGVPVISSRDAVQGLDVVDRRHCRMCDLTEFPAVISQMVAAADCDAISAMVDQAHTYAMERFDWSKISQRLLEETNGLMKAIDIWREGQTTRSHSTIRGTSLPVHRSRKTSLRLNVIGHVSGNLGLGVTARNVVRTLIERGCSVSILDLDPGLGRGAKDRTYQDITVASSDRLPHAMNLFVLPPTALAMLSEASPHLFSAKTVKIAFTMWELPVVPTALAPALETLDLIIAESEYIRHTFQCQLSGVHTAYAPHPLYLPDGIVGNRSRFGVPDDSVVFVTGFEPYSDVERKNTRAVIDAFQRSLGNNPRAYLLIKVNNSTAKGRLHESVMLLQRYAQGSDRIRFITDPFTYEEVLSLYAAADVFVSLHRAEGLGLGMMEAMALGKPVIATGWSGNMSFMDHRCACLIGYRLIPVNGTLGIYRKDQAGPRAVWADPDVADAATWMHRLADDPELRRTIGEKARVHLEEFQRIARRGDFVDEIEALWRHREYRSQGMGQERQRPTLLSKPVDRGTSPPDARNTGQCGARNERTQRPLRILFQNRPTAKSHPGGDTVVMDLFRRELQQLGHRVDVALGPVNLDGYDLVQAFNFATPEVTDDYARRAVAANVPLIVATLYEDWPRFLTQSRAMTEVLRHYVESGRDQAGFREGVHMVRQLPAAKRSVNDYAARHAACLLAWSESEKVRLLHDYSDSRRVEVVMLGADHLNVSAVDSTLFEQTYGVKDFVLCVGRLETRKNQLMLLKSLEHDEIPIVFLTGGFTYQPNYVKLCRMFDRPGKTLFLDRVPEEMLAAAYRAARVLCMPSWYELPGLVALEALQFGCPVVASRWGTLPDYVPHGVEYCEPDDPEDIRAAILRSYQRKESGDPRELVRGFRWRESAKRLLSIYEEVLCRGRRTDWVRGVAKSETAGSVRSYERDPDAKSESRFVCSIIVPVSGDAESMKRCLTAISESTESIEYEVILIDNGCSSEMRGLFDALGGDVKVIRNQEPVGYAKACNQGAQASRGRYLVFVSHDMAPMDGWLRALVSEVDGHQEIGVVGGKRVHRDGTTQYGGIVFGRADRRPYYFDKGAPGDSPSVNQRREYQAVSGVCLLISRSRFMEIGRFDEQLGDGFEVVDLCLKVRESGLRVVYQPRATVCCHSTDTSGFLLQERDYGKRFLERWGEHWWLADEDLHYHMDRHKVVRNDMHDMPVESKQPLDGVKEQAAWAHVAATQAAAVKKDWEAVRRELALADEWPRDPAVLSWGAMVAERLQESMSRIKFLTRSVDCTNNPNERLALVRTLLEHKDLVHAEEQLGIVLTTSPNHAEGLLLKGILSMQREQYGSAEDAFVSALREGANRKKCLMGMGMAALGRAYAQGAWERFLQVLVDHPDDAEAIHWLLRAGTAQNRWDELADHLRAYVTRNPSDLAIRFALASVCFRGDQIEAARREYEALRMDAPAYDGLDQLGQMIAGREAPLITGAASC